MGKNITSGTKVKLRWVKDLNEKGRTLKLLEENREMQINTT